MHFLEKVQLRRNSLVTITLVVLVVVMVVSLLMPQQYRSQARLLIIQQQSQSVDAYLAAKAAEKIGHLFSEVVYSSSFFDKVWNAGYEIGTEWGDSPKQRRKLWQGRVDVHMIPQTSLLEVNAYHTDKGTAENITRAVTYVITQQGDAYHGGGEDVTIKLVDAPLTSDYPVKPNLLVRGILGLILGLLISLLYIYLKPEQMQDSTDMQAEQKMVGTPQAAQGDAAGFLSKK